MWDTAPREAGEVMDTAYSNCELPLHTDCTYLEQPPGLQLFNCTEQSSPCATSPLAGSTRLADGFLLAERLRAEHPDTLSFFCRVALPFQHSEGDVHMLHTAPVFRVHPLTGDVVSVRYNETDRAPLNTLSFHDVELFYEHARVLDSVLRSIEVAVRLEPGDAILMNNHRVFHGRHAFRGRRQMLGCYLPADDWQSRLRVLRHSA